MADKNIQMKKKNGQTWDNMFPITLDSNVFDTNGKSVKSQLAETENDLESRGTNLKNYEHMVVDGDWSNALNLAVENLSIQGGGQLIVPQGNYEYGEDIYIKENVIIQGVQGVTFTQKNNAQIYFYSRSVMNDIEVDISNLFNDGAIVFDNEHLRRVDSELSKPEGVGVYLKRVSVISEFNQLTDNKSAFKFYSTFSVDVNAHGAGFARVNMEDCSVKNINVGIDIVTEKTGWVNGNNLDVRMTNIVNGVRIHRSSNSLGVDYNIFKLYIQCSENTKDLFIDGRTSNNYDSCTIWDMETYTNARVGTAILKNTQDGKSTPKQRYHTYLLRNSYHLIGRFTKFTSIVNHVMLSMVGYENYRVDYFIRGGSNPVVEKRNLGSNRDVDDFDFYIKELNNGEVELYIHNPSLDREVELVTYIESFRSFFPSPVTTYETIEGLTKLEVANYYPENSSQQRIFLTQSNSFTGETHRDDFEYGVTYSRISSDTTNKGTPSEESGLLITHKIVNAPPRLNYQEFMEYSLGTLYRRQGTGTTDNGWDSWRMIPSEPV